jgi:hypothetical protein
MSMVPLTASRRRRITGRRPRASAPDHGRQRQVQVDLDSHLEQGEE